MDCNQAIEHELSLDVADLQLLLCAISTLVNLQSHIEDQNMTLLKLRKLLGMVKSSEKRQSSHRRSKDKALSENSKPPRKKITKADVERKTEHHTFEILKKDDVC